MHFRVSLQGRSLTKQLAATQIRSATDLPFQNCLDAAAALRDGRTVTFCTADPTRLQAADLPVTNVTQIHGEFVC